MSSRQKSSDSTEKTLKYYEENWQPFSASTQDADVSDLRAAFCTLLPDQASVLDFGCGSGRDLKAFKEAGYTVCGLDGCEPLARQAQQYAGVPVVHQSFEDFPDDVFLMDKEPAQYDGIWACASLLHLQQADLVRVINALHASLKPDGIQYASFKYGTSRQWRNGRWFYDLNEQGLQDLLQSCHPFQRIRIWKTQDVRKDREQECWLNVLLKKAESNAGRNQRKIK